jgi:UDP-glucuronate 4-epimerase
MSILVTGSAGFIGFHLANRLLQRGDHVIGFDNLNPYYDVNLKLNRLALLQKHPNFSFYEMDLADQSKILELFQNHPFNSVIHLAAQAGVRYSIENPDAYIQSNLVGFSHILEACRKHTTPHLIFASSSSVYGTNTEYPFSESHFVDHPISLYAATKKANELMAHSYSHLYNLPCTGLRFFTVYGPWGRPDMALFKFTQNILSNKPIEIYNHGNMMRDFTYISDIVEGIIRIIDHPHIASQPAENQTAPCKIYNIGNNQPVKLMDFVESIEQYLNKKAHKIFLPLQAGDVPMTYADISQLNNDFGFKPETTIQEGVQQFLDWYLQYYECSKTETV